MMNEGKTLFAQVMARATHREFQRWVRRYRGDYRVRQFTCWDHFLTLAFAQLTYCDSLRAIEVSLGAVPERLYTHGHPWNRLAEHPRGCERETELADLRPLRPDPDPRSAA